MAEVDPLKNLTLKSALQRSVELFGDRPALAPVDGEPITYAEFGQKVQEISELLHSQGIAAGDRVGILSESQPNWGIAYFAITTIGAIAVPIFPEFVTNAVQHILRHAGCKAIFVSERLYDKLEDCQSDALATVILIDNFTPVSPQTKKDGLGEAVRERTKEFAIAALRMTGRGAPPEVQEDDTALIIYTSGTTGHSKGVILTHKNLVFDAQATTPMVNVTEQDRLLSILPLSHTFESTVGLLCPVMCGASVYYLDKPPSARVLMSAMAKVKPTIMLSVPLVMEKIYKTRVLPQLTRNVFACSIKWPRSENNFISWPVRNYWRHLGANCVCWLLAAQPFRPKWKLFCVKPVSPIPLAMV
jgi:long-chain acyl-CoA synthetase